MILELPWPPSINGYWRHVVMGKRAAVLLSAKGREYRQQVMEHVNAAGIDSPLDGRLGVLMLLHAPTRRKYDIDNRLKAVLDGLEHAAVFIDDEQVDRLEVIRGDVRKNDGAVIVHIETLR